MGNLCKNKKDHDPNLIDEAVKHSEFEDPYDLSYEVKKAVVVVYIDSTCKQCTCQEVISLLLSINLKPLTIEISKDSNPRKLLKALKKMTKDTKPPFIFLTGKYFGGLNEVDAGIKSHTVQKIVNDWLNTRSFGQN